jgi:hypothetical protein
MSFSIVQHPGTTIVTDSVTSDGLTTFIEQKLGGCFFHGMSTSISLLLQKLSLRISEVGTLQPPMTSNQSISL